MNFDPPLTQGVLLKRYKRFLVDVRLASGEVIVLHCANTGSMKRCLVAESPCWFSWADKPGRKLPGTLEIVTTAAGELAGVNTGRANALVREAIAAGRIAELSGYENIASEVRYGSENSRIDLLLTQGERLCYVEVKNVTLEAGDGWAQFPDATTARGVKHLRELMRVAAEGHRAVLFFCTQLSGARKVSPAAEIDPNYARTLCEAMNSGVEVFSYGCRLAPEEISIQHRIDFIASL